MTYSDSVDHDVCIAKTLSGLRDIVLRLTVGDHYHDLRCGTTACTLEAVLKGELQRGAGVRGAAQIFNALDGPV